MRGRRRTFPDNGRRTGPGAQPGTARQVVERSGSRRGGSLECPAGNSCIRYRGIDRRGPECGLATKKTARCSYAPGQSCRPTSKGGGSTLEPVCTQLHSPSIRTSTQRNRAAVNRIGLDAALAARPMRRFGTVASLRRAPRKKRRRPPGRSAYRRRADCSRLLDAAIVPAPAHDPPEPLRSLRRP